MDGNELYTEDEAAEILRMSKSTLGRIRKAEGIEWTPMGTKGTLVRYTKAQLDAYIRSQSSASTSAE